MRYIIAPTVELAGKGVLDFCWSTPGEPLIIGSKCSRDTPTGACGCRRAMSGILSRKATTIGIIAEIPYSMEQLAKASYAGFYGTAIDLSKSIDTIIESAADALSDTDEWQGEDNTIIEVVEVAKQLPLGIRVGFEFTGQDGINFTVFEAGKEPKKGYGV